MSLTFARRRQTEAKKREHHHAKGNVQEAGKDQIKNASDAGETVSVREPSQDSEHEGQRVDGKSEREGQKKKAPKNGARV